MNAGAQARVRMSGWLNNRRLVYASVALLSGALTLYKTGVRDIINGDGILYIEIARAFLDGGTGAALAVYHWPFYGILIALVHGLSGLGFEQSANLLNTLLLMLVCVAFVRVYEAIAGSEARLWVAALLILSLPVLNDYRDFVIRGYGFWAFLLLALHGFIRYSRSPGLLPALQWQLCLVAAILFRLEGIAFLVLGPLCLLLFADTRRRLPVDLLRLNGLFILLAAGGVLALLLSGQLQLPDAAEVPNQLGYASPAAVLGALDAEAQAFVARNRFMHSVEEARLILAAGLFTLVLVKVATNAGLTFIAVWAWGVWRKWLRLSRESHIVLWFAAIGLLTLVVVAGKFFFLSSRYTVPTVLLLSLISFQYVDALFRRLADRRLGKWQVLAGVVVLALFLDGVISGGAGKHNIREAGTWLAAGAAPPGRIACNEARLRFYADNRCDWLEIDGADPGAAIAELRAAGYTHLLLWVDRKQAPLRAALDADTGLALEKEFRNRRGDSVRYYRLLPEGQ